MPDARLRGTPSLAVPTATNEEYANESFSKVITYDLALSVSCGVDPEVPLPNFDSADQGRGDELYSSVCGATAV